MKPDLTPTRASKYPWSPIPLVVFAACSLLLLSYATCIKDWLIARRTRDSLLRKARSRLAIIRRRLRIAPNVPEVRKLRRRMVVLENRLSANVSDEVSLLVQPALVQDDLKDIKKLEDDMNESPEVPQDDPVSENSSDLLGSVSPQSTIVELNSYEIHTTDHAPSALHSTFRCDRFGRNPDNVHINSICTGHTAVQFSSDEEPSVMQKHLFVSLYSCIRSITHSNHLVFNSDVVSLLESMQLSEYTEWLSKNSKPFTVCMDDPAVRKAVTSLDPGSWNIEYPTPKVNRFSVRSRNSGSFIVVIDDFLLVYEEKDCKADTTVSFQVPGSPWLTRKYQEVVRDKKFFDSLIGKVLPVQQVHFLARRFVQLTGANWEYDCLASIERTRANASALRWYPDNLFCDITIELGATLFNCISGVHGIGRFDNKEDTLYNVCVQLFGDVIGFRRGRCNIGGRSFPFANPVHLPKVKLIACPEIIISKSDFAIGGDTHTEIKPSDLGSEVSTSHPTIDERSFADSTALESEASQSTNCGTSSVPLHKPKVLLYGKVLPMMLALGSFTEENGTEHPVFNLAYIPKNRLFKDLMKKKYRIDDFEVLKADFIRLGYGEQLSDCIQHTVINELTWTSDKTITLAEAQYALFRFWGQFKNKDLVALTLGTRRYIPRDEKFLVLCNNKLYFASSKVNISQQTMFSNVEAQSVMLGAPISNLQDAVENLSGIRIPVLSWNRFEPLLGAVALICFFLEGRVLTRGRFGNFPDRVTRHTNTQSVEFNIPIPSGVACSTFMREFLYVPTSILVDDEWNLSQDYQYPLILGVRDDDCSLIPEIRETMLPPESSAHSQSYGVKSVLPCASASSHGETSSLLLPLPTPPPAPLLKVSRLPLLAVPFMRPLPPNVYNATAVRISTLSVAN